ncbi:MAG: hypothetical protein ACLSAP_00455 [Oscillospiraceae bacterium]
MSHKRTGAEAAETFDESVTAYDKLGASRPDTLESDLKQGPLRPTGRPVQGDV